MTLKRALEGDGFYWLRTGNGSPCYSSYYVTLRRQRRALRADVNETASKEESDTFQGGSSFLAVYYI